MASLNYAKSLDLGGGWMMGDRGRVDNTWEGGFRAATPEETSAWDKYFASPEYINGKAKAAEQAAQDNDFDFGNLIVPAIMALTGAGFMGALPAFGAAGAGGLSAAEGGLFAGLPDMYGGMAAANSGGAAGAFGGATGAANMADWWTDLGLDAIDVGEAANAWTTNPGISDLTGGVLNSAGSFDPSLIDQFKTALNGLPTGAKEVASQAMKAMANGDSSALATLKSLGLPAALIAGLFEKNTNPLTGNVTQASNAALSSAGAFGAMPAVGMQPSWQKAIDTANTNTGAWKPYVDKAATYTDQAAGGIPSVDLSQYMNPYIANTLDPVIRNINLSADKERQRLAHLARISGNDTYATPGSTSATRYGVEEGTLNDNRFKQIGDATSTAYKGAFDSAVNTASADLNRKGSAGGAFNTMANTVGTQGRGDVTTLAGAGDLEAKPKENDLTHKADTAKLYTSIIPGTTSAITATNQPSILGQAVGAFGAYNAATKPGGILA